VAAFHFLPPRLLAGEIFHADFLEFPGGDVLAAAAWMSSAGGGSVASQSDFNYN
jgi:hypothetical protein